MAKEPIKIGAILPLTGGASWIGDSQRKGLELAVDEINSMEGINGKKVQLIVEDSKSNPKEGVSAFNKIIYTNSDISAIFSSLSSVSNAVLPLADKNKIPLLLLGVSLPDITEKSEWAVRMNPDSDDEIVKLKEFITRKFNDINKWAVIYINDEYGVKAKGKFIKEFSGKIVLEESYAPNEVDFKTILAKLKDSNAEGVFVVGFTQAYPILLKQMKEMDVEIPKFSLIPTTFPPIIKASGNAIEGIYSTAIVLQNTPKSKEFTNKYKSKFGGIPGFFSFLAYDGVKILASTIEKEGASPTTIKNRLKQVKYYPGISGNITIKENGDVDFDLVIIQVKDGKPVLVSK
ncbi:MAG TPA: amino acid ABC transporter substrate-binding protein [Candidatus Portnoybacteria bacterium]|nr:amino acid ABC transporter substrate-binding protein [Candidatus Portnoybacteria bacterium]